ncbi:MAG: endonuclease V [Candidatus Zixiibacteriota bacterium]
MSNFQPIESHPWSVSLEEAKEIQRKLSRQVTLRDDFGDVKRVLGVGIVFSKDEGEVFVGCVSFSFPELRPLEAVREKQKISFPYIPGFFAFSAGPAILSAIKKMERPDLILFPGRGVEHPRRLGLASHLGLLLDLPTIACSKTPLWRNYPEPSSKKGAHVLVKEEKGDFAGAVVRSREDVKPIFVSAGHRISIQTAVKIILHCTPKYRMPEPLRQAQILAKRTAEEA